ncbi:MAG: hypothetical protein Q7U71_08055, partial [bacterium]|nr:hypothetical protein [bacterium]
PGWTVLLHQTEAVILNGYDTGCIVRLHYPITAYRAVGSKHCVLPDGDPGILVYLAALYGLPIFHHHPNLDIPQL